MKNLISILPFTLLCFLYWSCASENTEKTFNKPATLGSEKVVVQKKERPYVEFDRKGNIKKLKEKISRGEPISIHLRVPLCDNKNQGIVPVSKKLGNGLDLHNNLYWGAKYGVKNYFNNISQWTLLESEKDLNDNILERVVFYREYSNKARAYLIADAHRGDKMKDCLMDFMHAMSGRVNEEIVIEDETIKIGSNADLLVFNGHNGLMDYDIEFVETADEKVREISVIGCISHNYFVDHLKHSMGYPLLMTTNLMAPEAYVLSSLIDAWILLKEEEKIRTEVGKSYHKYQKCGLKGATRLFKTGW